MPIFSSSRAIRRSRPDLRSIPLRRVPLFHSLEPLEARIAPANFTLPIGQGPYRLELDPADAHLHITNGVGTEIFDQGVAPYDDLFVTGGGPGELFTIASSTAGNIALTGTLSVVIPGPINVTGPAGTGVDLVLTSTGAQIAYSTGIGLGASKATFTADRNIVFTAGSQLSTVSGNIVLVANDAQVQNGTFNGIQLNQSSITSSGTGSIQLNGRGGNLGNGNDGIALLNSSVIASTSLANGGGITLIGNGGNASSGNRGVFIDGSAVSSASSGISVTGFGGDNVNGAGNNVGVLLVNGGQINSTGGNLPLVVDGNGGDGADFNHGVRLDGSTGTTQISSTSARIQITGNGSAAALGQGSHGIAIEAGAQIVGTGIGPVTLTGTAGGGTNNLQGVLITGAGSTVVSAGGALSIIGTGGGGAPGAGTEGVFISAGGKASSQSGTGVFIDGTGGGNSAGVALTGTGTLVESNGTGGARIRSNSFSIDASATIAAGSGGATIRPLDNNFPVNLGGADAPGTVLGISDAELDRVTGSGLTIESLGTGTVNVSSAITAGLPLTLSSESSVFGVGAITMSSGNGLTVNSINGVDLSGVITVGSGSLNLASSSVATITLTNPANNFGTVNIGGTSPSGTVSLRDDGGFDLGATNLNMRLTVESAGTITQSGAFIGSGELAKAGTGTLILSQANTYAGMTVINAGTLQIGNGGTGGTLGGGAVQNSGVLVFSRGSALTVSNDIGGNGNVQISTGTVTLGGNSGYTGTTSVTGGTLLVDGTLANTSSVSVSAGATLGGSGTINAGVPASIAGNLAPGGSPGVLRTGNITFSAGSNFGAEINGVFPAHDQVSVNGTVTLSGATLTPSGTVTSVPGQQIVLIANDGTEAINGTFANLAEGTPVVVNGVTFTISYAGGTDTNDVVLTQPAVQTGITLNSGSLQITDLAAGGHNDMLTISGGLAGTPVRITDPNSILGVTGVPGAVVSADFHTVTIPAASLGTGAFLINTLGGDDTLILDYSLGDFGAPILFFGGANGVAGDKLIIQGGTSGSSSLDFLSADSGNVTSLAAGRIDYLSTEALEFTQAVGFLTLLYRSSGAQTININDAGGLKTNVTSTAGVPFNFVAPTTQLLVAGNLGADTINLNSISTGFPATISIDGQSGTDVINVAAGLPTLPRLVLRGATISPLPALSIGAGGLSAVATGGGITVGGNLDVTGPLSLGAIGPITNPAGVVKAPTVSATGAGITLTLDGGSITAINSSAANVTLNSVNPATTLASIEPGLGITNLASGSFVLGRTDAINRSSTLAVGGALEMNGFLQTLGALSGSGSITNTSPALSVLTLGSGGASGSYAGTLSGHLRLEKIGAGTQVIAGAHSAVDGTTVTAGTLQFDAIGSALDGAFTLAGGTLLYNLPTPVQTLSPNIALTADSTIGVAAGKAVILSDLLSGPGGLTKSGAGILVLANQQNSFGPAKVQIVGGALSVATDGALGDPGNDVTINNATFTATSAFASARNFSRTGGTATIDAQAADLVLINKAFIPTDFTATNPANLATFITYADTTPVPENAIVVGNTAVSLAGGGTLTIHKTNPTSSTIDTIELTGTTSATKLIVKAVDPNAVTTVLRIVIDDPAPGTIASIGSIVLGKNVRLGDGVPDSVPDLYVEGKVGSLQLYDVNSHAIIRLGESLPHGVTGDKKTPSTKTNLPNVTIHEVLGPGVLIDLTPSDLPPDTGGDLIGGGGLGKVVVDSWAGSPTDPGFIRTTQSMKSFKLLNGDSFVVFHIDKFHVGSDTEAGVGSMTIQNGAWGSSGSEVEGEVGSFNADEFLAGASLTAGSMGKTTLDAGAFAGLLTLTDPDAPGIPTFTVNGNFSGSVDSESPLRKIKVKGDFTGELEAPFIGAITAYAFIGTNTPGEYNAITATAGALGTLTATAGVVRNFSIVTDQAFKGFNIKLGKLVNDTIGIDNVHIQALSIGNIGVSLAAAKGASGIDLTGIRNSQFITTGNGTAKGTLGSIGNVTVTLTGTAGGGSATGIHDSTFDALVAENEFGANLASTVNPLGKITVKIVGQDGVSLGLDTVEFSGDSIGATAVSVTPGKGVGALATAIDTAAYTATGGIGALAISGSATSAMVTGLTVSAGNNVGAVTVKSSIAANGTLKDSAILAGQALDMNGAADPAKLAKAALGAVNVTGSILNSRLVAGGSVGAITAGRDLTDSLILAGAELGGDFSIDGNETYQRTAAIAAITVKGAFARTSIVAGIDPGNGVFGDLDDTAATNLPGTSSIGAISLAVGSLAPATGTQVFAIEAGTIKSLKLGTNPAAAITSAQLLDLAPSGVDTDDIIVRLV